MELRQGYKLTDVGVIPEDWKVCRFLDAVRIANGQVDPKVEPYKSMMLIAPDHVESGTGRLLAKQTAAAQSAISGKYLFGAGDLIYSKIRPYLRKAVLTDFDGLCSADMYPLKPTEGMVAGYLLAVILGDRFSKYAESVSVRSGMPKINRVELADFDLPHPPTVEQRAISTTLSDVDALIAGLEKLIAKKRDLKQAAMQQLLTGQTRLPGFSGEWAVKKLGEIGATYGGLIGKGKADFGHGAAHYVPFVNVMANVRVDCDAFDLVDVGENEIQNKVRCGDLLFNGSSETPEEVAMCSLMTVAIDDLYLNSFCFGFRLKEKIQTDGLFLAYYMRGPSGRNLVKSLAQGSTRYNLSKSALLAAEMALPEKQEQTAIAAVLSDMDTELSALESRLAKTRDLKQGMMQELLTGRTRLI